MEDTRKHWGDAPWDRGNVPRVSAAGKNTDVAIIGGGLTGASAAYHLAKRGIGCTIFEAARLGDGASGRTGGLVLEGTAVGPLAEVDSCLAELQKLVAEEKIDCDLHLPGCWEIEHRSGQIDRMLPWRDNDQPVRIARTVSGGVVQPAALFGGIARAAMRLGANVREGAAVQRIGFEPQLEIDVGGETIRPGHVVVAVNAWINHLLPDAPALRSSLTFACATRPLEEATLEAIGLSAHIPFYTADMPYLWGRTLADGGVIFGSYLVFGSPERLDEIDVSTGSSREALSKLQQRVQRLHPQLGNVGFSAAWAGPIAFTDEAVPLLGQHPRSSKILVAGGYAGHGVALSVRAGQLIARAIAESKPLPAWGKLAR